jgi:hypothetical protein
VNEVVLSHCRGPNCAGAGEGVTAGCRRGLAPGGASVMLGAEAPLPGAIDMRGLHNQFRAACLVVLCAAVFSSSGCADHGPLTRANLNRIKNGMTVEQVEEFMEKGEPYYADSTPEEIAELKQIEDKFKLLRWERGSRGIVVAFINGKVGLVYTRGF